MSFAGVISDLERPTRSPRPVDCNARKIQAGREHEQTDVANGS